MNNNELSINADINNMNTSEELFDGISLAYISLKGDKADIAHKGLENTIAVNYCKSGKMGWKIKGRECIYLGQGDFCVNIPVSCAESEIFLPNGSYEGLCIFIDVKRLTDNPPDLLRGTQITGDSLYEKLFKSDTMLCFAGNEQTEAIFRFFFDAEENVKTAYKRLKALELIMYLYSHNLNKATGISEYQAQQIETIKKIHEQLFNSLDKRFTIEELSRQYMINPTTLKTIFKSVYNDSIASHMKEHRMRQGAKLLVETQMSIAEIACAVGYDSQSKFSTAFKDFYRVLPKEYRKNHSSANNK